MFRVTGFWSLAGLVAAMVALADLVAHPEGTKALTNAVNSSERYALNAELGQTS